MMGETVCYSFVDCFAPLPMEGSMDIIVRKGIDVHWWFIYLGNI